MERLRELKEAAKRKEPSEGGGGGGAEGGAAPATALELAGIAAEVEAPVLSLPKRRRMADTMALLESSGGDSSSGDEGDGDGETGLLDWRAKKSAT